MGRLRIMGSEGDRQIEWREDDPQTLLRAEREFKRMVGTSGAPGVWLQAAAAKRRGKAQRL